MFNYNFEWDVTKAATNQRKHCVSFDRATTVFNDQFMLSIPDDEHSETEERWLTLGRTDNDKLLVVIHTFEESKAGVANIRIVSARLATKHEQRQYEVNL